MKELYIVFFVNGKEKAAYTARGTFPGELEDTKNLIAYENGTDPENVIVKTEYR
jgi:hypothetical protein